MSWAETMKINNNVKKTLNEQIREARFLPLRLLTYSDTFTPEKTGIYKVICVGAGGSGQANGTYVGGGGGGGVAIKTLKLFSTMRYEVTVSENTASFAYDDTAITATSGESATTSASNFAGGTAYGGDFNYSGTQGIGRVTASGRIPMSGSVGVFISELTMSKSTTVTVDGNVVEMPYGDGILGYGGGGTGIRYGSNSSQSKELPGQSPVVIIIPLEMEE